MLEGGGGGTGTAAKAPQFYRSCMDLTSIEAAGGAPLYALVVSAGLRTPLPSAGDANDAGLSPAGFTAAARATAVLHRAGAGPLFYLRYEGA